MKELRGEYDIVPVFSFNAAQTDTRFGSSAMMCEKTAAICGREPICTITKAEKLGPTYPLDLMLICPCTGNTAAKLSHGITDTPVDYGCEGSPQMLEEISACSGDKRRALGKY